MKRGILTAAVAIAVLTGCVTKSKYEALESQATADRTALAKEIAGLQSQRQDLQGQKQTLESQRQDLERQLTGLRDEVARRESQITSQKDEVDSLQKQITSLNERVVTTEKKAEEVSSQKDEEIRRLRGTYDSLVKNLEGEIAKGQIKVKQIEDRLSVQMVEKILFDSGKAEIKPEGREVLTKVANVLGGVKDKQIRIEGYTDSVPISAALQRQFPSNWELSAQRATTVVRFLEKGGVDGKVLAAVGYGPFKPIADNTTLEGRAENRRIEIVLTPLELNEAPKQ
jgi:chemotaxis protein MotB